MMFKRRLTATWVLIASILAVQQAFAASNLEADHNALRKIKTLFEDIVNNGKDPDLFAPYLAPNFVGISPTGEETRSVEDFKAYRAKLKETLLGSTGGYTEKFDPDRSEFYGDIAVAHGKAYQHVVTSDKLVFDTQTSWLLVAQKQNGMWKLLRMQASMDPINNAIVKLMIKKTRWMFGLGGLLLGLLIGFLIGWRFHRTAAK